MRTGKLTFVASMLAIFVIATTFIVFATNTNEHDPPPIFKPESSRGKDETTSATNPGSRYAKISDRVDLNLRDCPSADCKAIAILKRGGNVLLTGKRQLIESTSGAAIPWSEVISQSDYCIKLGAEKNLECIEWGGGVTFSGWVNALYIQEK